MRVERIPDFNDQLSREARELRYLGNLFTAGSAEAEQERWHLVGEAGEPPFENTWTNLSSDTFPDVAFMHDGTGIVLVRGMVLLDSPPASGGPHIFTLPEGHRPIQKLSIRGAFFAHKFTPAVWRGAVLLVRADGQVRVETTTFSNEFTEGDWLNLSDIFFPV